MVAGIIDGGEAAGSSVALRRPKFKLQALGRDGAKRGKVTVVATEEAAEKAAARLVQRVSLDFGSHPTYHGGNRLLMGKGVNPRTLGVCLVKDNMQLAEVTR